MYSGSAVCLSSDLALGAALEGSKAFAKQLMAEAGIPTAQHRTFTQARAAFAYLEEHGVPVVVKADGNAAGKGAIVALDMDIARDAVHQMMIERVFGDAGDIVVIEDYLQGDEIGSTVVCKGTHYLPLTLTQDHKRAFDGDRGLNTGGMGAFTPLPFVDKSTEAQIYRNIVAADTASSQGPSHRLLRGALLEHHAHRTRPNGIRAQYPLWRSRNSSLDDAHARGPGTCARIR